MTAAYERPDPLRPCVLFRARHNFRGHLFMRTSRFTLGTLVLAIPFIVLAAQPTPQSAASKAPPPRREPTTLVEKVRFNFPDAYRIPGMAMSTGWRNRTGCVDGPDGGGNGISLLFDPSPAPGFPPPYVADGILEPSAPEAMLYQPTGNGNFRLVAVEFIEYADHWAQMVKKDHTLPATPRVDGHLMHYVGTPNRYGFPAFYELHVWAFSDNPKGTFADWNPQVNCDRAQVDDLPNSDVTP
jgi:hypothetical protein